MPTKEVAKRFTPTKDQRAVVKRLVALGMPIDRVCLAVTNHDTGKPVAKETLREHFEVEIREARVKVDEKVAGYMLKHCAESFQACKFFVERAWGVEVTRGPVVPALTADSTDPTSAPVPAAADLQVARQIAFLLEKAARGLYSSTAPTS